MSIDVFALVTEWAPAVEAYREAGGLDFFWDANMDRNERWSAGDRSGDLPELPWLEEIQFPGGKGFLEPASYYDQLRTTLPPELRDPADALFSMIVPGDHDLYSWISADRDDLLAETGIRDGTVLSSLSPVKARAIASLVAPWDGLRDFTAAHPVEDDSLSWFPDWDSFEMIIRRYHLETIKDAADHGMGVITVLSA